jgi:hypothetical protein
MASNDPTGDARSGSGQTVSERRRALVKILTASAGAYAVPMVASFSMSGLRIDTAEAGELAMFGVSNMTQHGFPHGRFRDFDFKGPHSPLVGNARPSGLFRVFFKKFLPIGPD